MKETIQVDRWGSLVLKVIVGVGIPLVALALFHELLVVATGRMVKTFSEALWLRELLSNLPFSPARFSIMISTLSQIYPEGLAVDSVVGDVLHKFLPMLFLPSEQAIPGTWVSAVIRPESTPLARFVTQALVEVFALILGSVLVICGLKGASPNKLFKKRPVRQLILIGWGLFVQTQALLAIFGFGLTPPALEDMGVGFLIGPLTEGYPLRYEFLMRSVVPGVIRIFLVALGFLPILSLRSVALGQKTKFVLLALVIANLQMLVLPFPPYLGMVPKEVGSSPSARKTTPPVKTEKVSLPLATVTTSPAASPAVNQTPTPTIAAPKLMRFRKEQPTSVVIEQVASSGEFRLLVDNSHSTIRGVHYYFGDLVKKPPEEREKILRRDLGIIQQVGFNAVVGWEEAGFDERFLELASEYGLYVIKPISLQPLAKFPDNWNAISQGNFLDPTFRKEVKQNVEQKIKRNKDAPALLLWNIGADEPLEQMSRHYQRPPEQVQAAADLIVELSVLAHEIDPNHPTIISEPQDWHLRFYETGLGRLRRSGANPSSFFIVGGNFYQRSSLKTDLQRVKTTATEKLKVAFAVMEWAPFGVDRMDRPLFRARMAKEVAEITPISVVYVFNPAIDPLNYMPDPTLTIVTGLALTDQDRTDKNGLLNALASTLGRPLFPAALQILKADRERGWSGVPLSGPLPQEKGVEQYFVGVGPQGKLTAYRWLLVFGERRDTLIGPMVVQRVLVDRESRIISLEGPFLQAYLENGGPAYFGLPTGNAYETLLKGQPTLRQDFTKGWVIQK